ncbi:vesicular glutamate transporter 1-like [Chrysoperla carnea]|uniref:vesicular glutamate transporter 1-like n=1 Tax=Chrysoperla carnea TaxID=189513 RepID=UPI001D079DE0|nr:vesicular glutamate transporter 1-like [Chrysoperla carnea]
MTTVYESNNTNIFPNLNRLRIFQINKRYTLAILSHFGFTIAIALFTYTHYKVYISLYPDLKTLVFTLAHFFVQIPAAIYSYKYSATRLFGICILGVSILTFVCPILIPRYEPVLLGAADPAFYSIWRYWSPPLERSTLVALGYTGSFTGTLIVDKLVKINLFTVENSLYVYGLVGILWYFEWFWISFDHPRQHPSITEEEYVYLEQTVTITHTSPLQSIPWKKIFLNIPISTLLVTSFLHTLSGWVTMHFGENNFVKLITILVASFVSDLLLRKSLISTINLRKIYICGGLAMVIPFWSSTLVENPNDSIWVNILSPFAMVIYCIPLVGFYANHLEVAAEYSGITKALRNMVVTLTTILVVTPNEFLDIYTFHKRLFLILIIFGAIFYAICGSSEQQDLKSEQKDLKSEQQDLLEESRQQQNLQQSRRKIN